MVDQGQKIQKGRGSWSHWTGTPTDLAEIASLAVGLIQEGGQATARLSLRVTARDFEADFRSPDEIEHGLEPEDLAALEQIILEAAEVTLTPDDAVRRIGVTIAPPVGRSTSGQVPPPTMNLRVFGPDRTWVDLATMRMKERLNQGARATPKVRNALLACFLILVVAGFVALGFGSDDEEGLSAGELAALILIPTAFGAALFTAFLELFTPPLELLPEGGATRWERIRRRLRAGGGWLLAQVVASVISVAIGILIGRAFF